MKILIVKLSSMGDVLFALPVVVDIRRRYPDAQVDWVVDARFAEIPKLSACVRTVFAVPLKELKSGGGWALFKRFFSVIGHIRRERYDVLIDLHGVGKSSLLSWVARARQKWGYRDQDMAESMFSWAYNHRFMRIAGEHACAAYRHALEQVLDTRFIDPFEFGLKSPSLLNVGGTKNEVPESSSQNLRVAIERVGQAKFSVLFFPFASKEKKWIPFEQAVEMAQLLSAHGAEAFFLSGSAVETRQAQELAHACGAQVLPALPVAELPFLLSRVAYFVGADTGVSHLAAAFGLPTITVFRASKLERYGPHKWAAAGVSLHVHDPDWGVSLRNALSWLFSESSPNNFR